MRLKNDFEIVDMGDTFIAVPLGDQMEEFRGGVRLNSSAARFFELLQHETTEEKIVDALAVQYDAPREVIAADVHSCIADLTQKGFIAE